MATLQKGTRVSLVAFPLSLWALSGLLAACGSDGGSAGGGDPQGNGNAGAGGAAPDLNEPASGAGAPNTGGTSSEMQPTPTLMPGMMDDTGQVGTMMGCPIAPPTVGEMCMGMPGTCSYTGLECDCDGGAWVCWD